MFLLEEIAPVIRGEYLSPVRGGEVPRVSIDSRTILPGELFFAISGERFDGHDFLATVVERGGRAAVVRRTWWAEQGDEMRRRLSGITLIGCDDPLTGLQEMAAWHRRRLSAAIIGITGSNGKTTTKEMSASILSQKSAVLKSEGNFNNHIGLPLTLLRMTSNHRVAVVEMGINHPGEMELLCRIASPDMALITNIGEAHLEFFKDLAGVAKAKGTLFEAISQQGWALINLDDPHIRPWEQRVKRHLTFSASQEADVRLSSIQGDQNGMSFNLRFKAEGEARVHLASFGFHQARNALAAATIALGIGRLVGKELALTAQEIASGLAAFRPVSMRSQIISLGKFTIFFDAYNANPGSMRAALEALGYFKSRRIVAVLGDMLELGEDSEVSHRSIGRDLVEAKVSVLITVGEKASAIAGGAREAGMSSEKISCCSDLEEAADLLIDIVGRGDLILIKGSRQMKLEQLLDHFVRKKGEMAS